MTQSNSYNLFHIQKIIKLSDTVCGRYRFHFFVHKEGILNDKFLYFMVGCTVLYPEIASNILLL